MIQNLMVIPSVRQGRRDLDNRTGVPLAMGFVFLLLVFVGCGPLLRQVDGTAAVLDIGALSLLVFGLLAGVGLVVCGIWLQELLWQPLRAVRRDMVGHFNELTGWQRLILYFGVFFLWLYAWVWVLSVVI